MGKADVLSRMTGLETGENDNANQTLLKTELFLSALDLEMPEDELLQQIKQRYGQRETVVKNALESKKEDWLESDKIITWQNRIYVPKDRTLRSKIITLHHDPRLAGHPGRYKTLELITRTYWWPGISRDVQKYVDGCERCQATKTHRTKPVGLLHPHDVPTEPWQVVGMDMIGELPEAGGYNAITVFVNHFTK